MLKANYFLFDLDGTLLDTGDLIHHSFEYTFHKVLGKKSALGADSSVLGSSTARPDENVFGG